MLIIPVIGFAKFRDSGISLRFTFRDWELSTAKIEDSYKFDIGQPDHAGIILRPLRGGAGKFDIPHL